MTDKIGPTLSGACVGYGFIASKGHLPAYASFAVIVDPSAPNAIREEQRRAHTELHEKASQLAREHGVHAKGSIVEFLCHNGRYPVVFLARLTRLHRGPSKSENQWNKQSHCRQCEVPNRLIFRSMTVG